MEDFRKVLVFSAHPDDLDFGCAGTVAKMTEEGKEVVYCIITDGSKGVQKKEHMNMTGREVSAMRAREQKAAAKAVGVSKVLFLGEKDGELENTLNVREKIAKAIRIEKPDIVFVVDPSDCNFESFYRCHRDHRMGAEAVFDAIYPGAGSPAFYPKLGTRGITPHQIKGIWFYGTDKPNIFIDISKTIDKKIEALSRHESQFIDPKDMPKFIKERAKYAGKKRKMKYAEAFRSLTF
jgi:LmbE family N-acetylglucosaminyl deacetylase